ncbi:MAG: transcriptional repressor LexA [Coriobacteriales bacterium]|jgi:repressor LexA|nr:transcriptional repressor LexA [Coriobacteriales bacterium]
MDSKAPLTERQQGILDFLQTFTVENGYPPSVRQIGEAVGLSSSSTVHSHLNSLTEKGYIRRNMSSARALTVVDDAKTKRQSFGLSELPCNVVQLPVIGRVAAGEPIFAEQNIEETLTLPTQIVGDSSSFLLTVKGESMIEAGILDGDYIVVKEQQTARNGEIVVALIDDEATVKTYYREADRIRLQPENQTMDPIYVRDVVILGKVIALLRAL